MRRKSLKQVVVVLTVVSFLCAATAPSFAASTSSGNKFNILGNVPEQEARQLSDEEMVEVKGEVVMQILAALTLSSIIYLHWKLIDGQPFTHMENELFKEVTGLDVRPIQSTIPR